MSTPQQQPPRRRKSVVQSRRVQSKDAIESDWIEQRLKKMEEQNNPDAEGSVSSTPVSVSDENLLTCLRNISSIIESSVRKLYGHNIVDIKTAFAAFDEDGDGTIDRTELDSGLRRLGLPSTPNLIESVFSALSDNGTNIRYGQFLSMINWSLSTRDRCRRSIYRGVTAAPISSGRLWQAHLRVPASLVFSKTPEQAKFLIYTDSEVEAARAVDSALMDKVGVVDATPFLNFRDLSSLRTASAQAVERELSRRQHMAGAGRISVLSMLGKIIQSKRTLYGAKLSNLNASFRAMDTDNSGTIERDELDKALDRLGLGLTVQQKQDVADVLCSENTSGSITLESYMKIMNESKRAYAEELRKHRTLSAMGLLKPQIRRLKAPMSKSEAEESWDAHFAAPSATVGCMWDIDSDLRLDALNSTAHKMHPKKRNRHKSSTVGISETTLSSASSISKRREWEDLTNRVDMLVTTPAGEPVLNPGANTLRCELPDDMRSVAYPGSAIRDGLIEDPSVVVEMRQGRMRGFSTHDSKELRQCAWDGRTSISASRFNSGRHTAHRGYFDRPIVLDKNANMVMSHRHRSAKLEKQHQASPVERDRTLRNNDVGLIELSSQEIVEKFRGLRISQPGDPALYEVRCPFKFEDLKKYTPSAIFKHNEFKPKHAFQISEDERHSRSLAAAIKALVSAIKSGRKIYGTKVSNLKELFEAMDIDESGAVDLTTFQAVVARYKLGLSQAQLQAMAKEFDQDNSGTIEYEEVLESVERNLKKLKTDKQNKLQSSVASSLVQSKEEQEMEWRKQRRKSLEQSLSSFESGFSHENGINNLCPATLSSLVGYYNSPERAARAYDASIVGRFGYEACIPFMNMPECSPELWPTWQRYICEGIRPDTSPYHNVELVVQTPGEKGERPETPFVLLENLSGRRLAKWRKGQEISTKTDSLHLSPNTPNQTASRGNNISMRPLKPLAKGTPRSAISPRKKPHRYRNHNGVYVHYKKNAPKRRPEVKKQMINNSELARHSSGENIVDNVLDKLIATVKSRRTVFGHEITSIADAFMSFDRKGLGSLGVAELTDALRRLGVPIKRPAARKLIEAIDTDNSGRIEYDEFAAALEKRREKLRTKRLLNRNNMRKQEKRRGRAQSIEGIDSRPRTSASSRSQASDGQNPLLTKQERDTQSKNNRSEKNRLKKVKNLLNKLNPNLAYQLIAKFRSDGAHRSENSDVNLTFPDFFEQLHGRKILLTDGQLVKKTMMIWREVDEDQSGCVSMAEFLALLDRLN